MAVPVTAVIIATIKEIENEEGIIQNTRNMIENGNERKRPVDEAPLPPRRRPHQMNPLTLPTTSIRNHPH